MDKTEAVKKYERDQEEWRAIWNPDLSCELLNKPKPAHLETEPIFNIHITFCDGSKPMAWFNLGLKQAMVVLQEWSEDWILIPEDCKLNGPVWNWHANKRKTQKKPKEIEDYADILDPECIPEPSLEFIEPEE